MTTHPRAAAPEQTFLRHTNALLDVYPMLYKAALDQPNPSEDLKHALAVGERWAEQMQTPENRKLVAERLTTPGKCFQVGRLADELLRGEESC